MIIDFHSHSYFSDGVLSPKEVIQLASEAGCDFFSLEVYFNFQAGFATFNICFCKVFVFKFKLSVS